MKRVGGKKKGGSGRKMKDQMMVMVTKGMENSVIKLFGVGVPWKSLGILIFFMREPVWELNTAA